MRIHVLSFLQPNTLHDLHHYHDIMNEPFSPQRKKIHKNFFTANTQKNLKKNIVHKNQLKKLKT